MDLGTFINSKGCECLNESDEHTLEHALSSKGGYLESDCDEQVSRAITEAYLIKMVVIHVVQKGKFYLWRIFLGEFLIINLYLMEYTKHKIRYQLYNKPNCFLKCVLPKINLKFSRFLRKALKNKCNTYRGIL